MIENTLQEIKEGRKKLQRRRCGENVKKEKLFLFKDIVIPIKFYLVASFSKYSQKL